MFTKDGGFRFERLWYFLRERFGLSPREEMLYVELSRRRNYTRPRLDEKTGLVFGKNEMRISIRKLAQAVELERKLVQRLLEKFRQMGLITMRIDQRSGAVIGLIPPEQIPALRNRGAPHLGQFDAKPSTQNYMDFDTYPQLDQARMGQQMGQFETELSSGNYYEKNELSTDDGPANGPVDNTNTKTNLQDCGKVVDFPSQKLSSQPSTGSEEFGLHNISSPSDPNGPCGDFNSDPNGQGCDHRERYRAQYKPLLKLGEYVQSVAKARGEDAKLAEVKLERALYKKGFNAIQIYRALQFVQKFGMIDLASGEWSGKQPDSIMAYLGVYIERVLARAELEESARKKKTLVRERRARDEQIFHELSQEFEARVTEFERLYPDPEERRVVIAEIRTKHPAIFTETVKPGSFSEQRIAISIWGSAFGSGEAGDGG